MIIEAKIDTAGLFLAAPGLSLHIYRDPRGRREPWAWASAEGGAALFRVGPFLGAWSCGSRPLSETTTMGAP